MAKQDTFLHHPRRGALRNRLGCTDDTSCLIAMLVYKICSQSEWHAAENVGVFRGSSVDRRDGFIHFSTATQAVETAARHFAGQIDLVLVAVDAEKLGPLLKWEPSRGGALFPHLYGDLDLAAVCGVAPLPLGDDGRHRFPPLAGG